MKDGQRDIFIIAGLALFFSCVSLISGLEFLRWVGVFFGLAMFLVPLFVWLGNGKEKKEEKMMLEIQEPPSIFRDQANAHLTQLRMLREKLTAIMRQIEKMEALIKRPDTTIVIVEDPEVFFPLMLGESEKTIVDNIVEAFDSSQNSKKINSYIETFGLNRTTLRFTQNDHYPKEVETSVALAKIRDAKTAIEETGLFVTKELNDGNWV
jgi:hypothetical protein